MSATWSQRTQTGRIICAMHGGYLEIGEEHQDMPGHDPFVRVSELLP